MSSLELTRLSEIQGAEKVTIEAYFRYDESVTEAPQRRSSPNMEVLPLTEYFPRVYSRQKLEKEKKERVPGTPGK